MSDTTRQTNTKPQQDWKTQKLAKLAEIEGQTVMGLIEQATFDSVCPGICMNPGCDYTTEVEPDQDKGYCENCDTGTVKSALLLAGFI